MIDVARVLLSRCGDATAWCTRLLRPDVRGATALHHALSKGFGSVVTFLMTAVCPWDAALTGAIAYSPWLDSRRRDVSLPMRAHPPTVPVREAPASDVDWLQDAMGIGGTGGVPIVTPAGGGVSSDGEIDDASASGLPRAVFVALCQVETGSKPVVPPQQEALLRGGQALRALLPHVGVNQPLSDGATMLAWCADAMGHDWGSAARVASLLLASGADPNAAGDVAAESDDVAPAMAWFDTARGYGTLFIRRGAGRSGEPVLSRACRAIKADPGALVLVETLLVEGCEGGPWPVQHPLHVYPATTLPLALLLVSVSATLRAAFEPRRRGRLFGGHNPEAITPEATRRLYETVQAMMAAPLDLTQAGGGRCVARLANVTASSDLGLEPTRFGAGAESAESTWVALHAQLQPPITDPPSLQAAAFAAVALAVRGPAWRRRRAAVFGWIIVRIAPAT